MWSVVVGRCIWIFLTKLYVMVMVMVMIERGRREEGGVEGDYYSNEFEVDDVMRLALRSMMRSIRRLILKSRPMMRLLGCMG